jgi:hypothetical protein
VSYARTATVSFTLLAALSAPVLSAPVLADLDPLSPEEAAQELDRGVLRIRNNTPFIMLIYVSGIRAGWIKPFRTELFRGLKDGGHKIYAHSEYGSASWGPRSVKSPGTLNLTVDPAAQVADMDTALASKIYQLNKNSLVACDKLAERRGEVLKGTRAEFEVKVDDNGKGEVTVTAEEIEEKLLSCYKAVVKQWTFPATGSPYALSLTHMH